MTAPTTTTPIRVLLVENNPRDAQRIVQMLRDATDDFDLQRVEHLAAALDQLGRAAVDVVLLDLGLPDSQGLATVERARQGAAGEPIIALSDVDDDTIALETVRAGAQDYLVKGRIDGRGLARVIRIAIERQRSEIRVNAIVRAALDAHVMMDADGKIRGWNPQAETVFRWSAAEVMGRPLADIIIPPAQREKHANGLRRFLTTGAGPILNQRVELTAIRKDGREFPVELSVTPIRVGGDLSFSAFLRDITERKQLLQHLIESQKMEAVGRLAGGVAHDFNNLLTTIFGYTELLAEQLPAGSPARHDVEEIQKAGHRAATLTRQLLAFRGQQILQPVVLSVNDLVEDLETMLRSLIGGGVKLRTMLAKDAGNVRADRGQLEQVVVNLVVNARDAMPNGGSLSISTQNAVLNEEYAKAHQTLVPGAYVALLVRDTGVGMDAQTQARIFEPFFTTGVKVKGTGLGLSTAHGIVQQSGGYIWAHSEPGQGSTFTVYLPRVDAPVGARVRPAAPPATLSGTETVLLAEDDELLRPLARGLLEKLGYTVLDAATAEEALSLARAHHGPIHLLIADVVMPGDSGRGLARRLAEVRPDTRVLYTSGYTGDAIVYHGMLEPGLSYLQKPFTPVALAQKVRQVLDVGRLVP